jgi:hypothetical protein
MGKAFVQICSAPADGGPLRSPTSGLDTVSCRGSRNELEVVKNGPSQGRTRGGDAPLGDVPQA